MNIYEKLSAITNELETIAKNFTVGEGKFSYKAVKEGDVLSAVKPLEEKYKVYSYPIDRKVIYQDIIDYENAKGEKSTKVFMRVETTYRFVNIENPDEFADIKSYGDGVDSQDKACGKAMTYSDKYALLKAYKIETGDDPDKDMSETIVKTSQKPTDAQSDKLSYAMNLVPKYGKYAGKRLREQPIDVLRSIADGGDKYLQSYAQLIVNYYDQTHPEGLPFNV